MVEEVIGVVGAGLMGAEIALVYAVAGHRVLLHDVSADRLATARTRLADIAEKGRARGFIKPEQADGALDRLETTVDLARLGVCDAITEAVMARVRQFTSLAEAVQGADFVVEAATEKLQIKRNIFAELSKLAPQTTIIATNSSSIASRKLADVTEHPERLLNWHFTNHPWLRPYVETMTCGQTKSEYLDVAQRLGKSLGIASAMVHGELMGFIHNYVWRQIKKAAMTVVDEGHASVEDVDRAVMLGLRAPNGPFQMMDRAGLDVMLDIERMWYAESGEERDKPPKVLEDLVAAGHLGQKTGKGFYTYPNPVFERPGWLLGQDE